MKGRSYIAISFLICFSVILMHNLVPHHHHAEIMQSPVASDCPFEHADHRGEDQREDSKTDAERHPLHCHAFNDVVFEVNKITFQKPEHVQVLTLFLSRQLSVPEKTFKYSVKTFTPLKFPCKSYTDLETRGLRGPPAFT